MNKKYIANPQNIMYEEYIYGLCLYIYIFIRWVWVFNILYMCLHMFLYEYLSCGPWDASDQI